MKYYFAVGRRKTAIARAKVFVEGKGEITVNGIAAEKYFSDPYSKARLTELFHTTNTVNRFNITILVEGSGMSGQLGATTLAIARALVQIDPKFKAILRKKDYMTRDPRGKERKKAGLPGARKKKSSPKR